MSIAQEAMIPWLDPDGPAIFPPTSQALPKPNGLLAAGGALTPDWLLTAYQRGIFPFFEEDEGPLLWWSPDPRTVLIPEAFRFHRSLRKAMRQRPLSTSLNRACLEVLRCCAELRPRTWLTPKMQQAYAALHAMGYVQSIEVFLEGSLVGGLYGVVMGAIFFGESMFHRIPDASKVALARLVYEALQRGITLIDCQMPSQHLAFMGACQLPRPLFEAIVRRTTKLSAPQPMLWQAPVLTSSELAARLAERLNARRFVADDCNNLTH